MFFFWGSLITYVAGLEAYGQKGILVKIYRHLRWGVRNVKLIFCNRLLGD